MGFFSRLDIFPKLSNSLLALASAILLALSFPNFELWFLAWIALVPLLIAIDRESRSARKSFALGWIFGAVFFFATCWWLAYAPIHYAGFPSLLAYFLVFCATAAAAIFPGICAAIFAFLLRRFGVRVSLAVPFIWVFTEFLRYWLTGNNWNAIGYSQAFGGPLRFSASLGGIYLVSFACLVINTFNFLWIRRFTNPETNITDANTAQRYAFVLIPVLALAIIPSFRPPEKETSKLAGEVVAVQPNVPMSGLTYEKWKLLRQKHVELAESGLSQLPISPAKPVTVIFPESPMNFAYEEDEEFREFVSAFAARNNVNVLFNSAEPDTENKKYFNSAVLVNIEGREIAQYDKIYLLPFGEAVPAPLQSIVPAFVGSFSYGRNFSLVPLGDARAGIMICFESHFGELSRTYVQHGADVIIEMTNDGYLGPTPVLRQHLANAVFRAVETDRPVLRTTNVGITAFINKRGEVFDEADSYTEAVRVWDVSKSNGSQTFYVKFGDWFAWLCAVVTLGLLIFGASRRRGVSTVAGG